MLPILSGIFASVAVGSAYAETYSGKDCEGLNPEEMGFAKGASTYTQPTKSQGNPLGTRTQSAAELAGADLESQFAELEASSDVDDELAALKALLLPGSSPTQPITPNTKTGNGEVTDTELESLRRQLDRL
ncbi:hypothetical protein NUACC21_41500 [Scytonema sp. NUACC21]